MFYLAHLTYIYLLRIHKIKVGEIYIVLFIQDKRKTPTSIQLNHMVHGEGGAFPEETVPTVNQIAEQVS